VAWIALRLVELEMPAISNVRAPVPVAVAAVLLAIALVASWMPARRVSQIAPAVVLKAS
jgi:ABC-type lipoprotein release transport system permease subunit